MNTTGILNWGKGTAGLAVLAAAIGAIPVYAADQWTPPTPEELSMTSLPGYPGAPAVILFREQITKDDLHVVQHYERIKVLTEKGKDQANVELTFGSFYNEEAESGNDKTITDISGRTIHPDGTVIPFTGKPYLKMIEKGKDYTYQARVFTLPDVEVGSIIEYRYSVRIADNWFESPDWYIQDELYTKSCHFAWYPTTRDLTSSEGSINSITWFPILPLGVTLARREMPGTGPGGKTQQVYEVTAKDIAPQPNEEYMPPIRSFTYRVMFAYSPFRSNAEFWKSEGKKWSKREDSFVGPDGSLKAATQTVIAGAQTNDEKLRKIYAAVMAMENTEFTRDHDKKEDKAEGVGKVSSAGDVFKRGRGQQRSVDCCLCWYGARSGDESLCDDCAGPLQAPSDGRMDALRAVRQRNCHCECRREGTVLRSGAAVLSLRAIGLGKHPLAWLAANR